MSLLRLGFDRGAGAVAAALLCAALSQHMHTWDSELLSEIFTWIILPLLVGTFQNEKAEPDLDNSEHTSSRSLWIAAICIGIVAVYKSEFAAVIPFLPILTPIILKYQLLFSSRRQSSPPSLFSPFVDNVRGAGLVAGVSVLTLSSWKFRPSTLLSLVPTIALLNLYIHLLDVTVEVSPLVSRIPFEKSIKSLSCRVLFVLITALLVQSALFEFPRHLYLPNVAAQALVKVLSWYYLASAAKYASWNIASTIGTCSMVSTRNPFIYTSGMQAFAYILCSLLALGQTIYMLPRALVPKRSFLWLLGLIPAIAFIASTNTIRKQAFAAETSFRFSSQVRHPVEILAQNARIQFDAMLHKHSQNYTAASREYETRYGRVPPRGFQGWYEYAVSQNSPIIDEFDMIFQAISPFFRISGRDVVKAMEQACAAPGSQLWACTFSPEKGNTTCKHPYRTSDRNVGQMFHKFLGNRHGLEEVGDVEFLVNHLDEPMVIIPRDMGSSRVQNTTRLSTQTDLAYHSTWEVLTKQCPEKSELKRTAQDDQDGIEAVDTYGIPFVNSTRSAMDICQNPQYGAQHGLFQSPVSFCLVQGLVPILSTGAPSTMGDILYPSAAYMEPQFAYDEQHDIEWDKKKNNLYWAGSTTGAFATDTPTEQWHHFHRQRFVTLANNLHTRCYPYLSEHANTVKRRTSTFLNLRLFDVAFTQISHCDRLSCRAQSRFFNPDPPDLPHAPLGHRLVFDLDGNGISGRFYRLLASHSCPLKQTVFREWHDERLVPWVHYIPVSMDMEELPELVQFLTLTERGTDLARRVAREGREWYGKAMREVDREIYVWRLMLELARVQDRGREADAGDEAVSRV